MKIALLILAVLLLTALTQVGGLVLLLSLPVLRLIRSTSHWQQKGLVTVSMKVLHNYPNIAKTGRFIVINVEKLHNIDYVHAVIDGFLKPVLGCKSGCFGTITYGELRRM